MKDVRLKTALSERDLADVLTELENDEPTLEAGTVVGTRVIRRGRIQNLEFSAHRGHGRVASGTGDDSAQNTINTVSTHVGNAGRQPYSNPTLTAQVDLLRGADTAPEAEAGNRAAIFRRYTSGVPSLIVVRDALACVEDMRLAEMWSQGVFIDRRHGLAVVVLVLQSWISVMILPGADPLRIEHFRT